LADFRKKSLPNGIPVLRGPGILIQEKKLEVENLVSDSVYVRQREIKKMVHYGMVNKMKTEKR